MMVTDDSNGCRNSKFIGRRATQIDPQPAIEAFNSTSVDLKLGSKLTRWKAKAGVPVRPGNPDFKFASLEDHQEHIEVSDNGFTIEPKQFVLGWTEEVVELPIYSRIAARIEGKSSLARLGIGVHVTAPTIHAGFKGQIRLKIFNSGPIKSYLIAACAYVSSS